MHPNEVMSLNSQLENIKRPPSSIDAERSVIGGLILDNEAWFKIEEILRPDDFYSTQHRIVFRQMQS